MNHPDFLQFPGVLAGQGLELVAEHRDVGGPLWFPGLWCNDDVCPILPDEPDSFDGDEVPVGQLLEIIGENVYHRPFLAALSSVPVVPWRGLLGRVRVLALMPVPGDHPVSASRWGAPPCSKAVWA